MPELLFSFGRLRRHSPSRCIAPSRRLLACPTASREKRIDEKSRLVVRMSAARVEALQHDCFIRRFPRLLANAHARLIGCGRSAALPNKNPLKAVRPCDRSSSRLREL